MQQRQLKNKSSGEKMNKVGSKDAPTAQDFKESEKTSRRSLIEDAYDRHMK